MSLLDRQFRDLATRGRRALMPFLTAGYPDPATFRELVHAAIGAGADVIEVGVPFSDPLADGPAIQHSSTRALAQGMSLPRILDEVAPFAREAPIVLMTYVNPLLGAGWDAFARSARAAGVAGVIVPDLPLEEGRDLEDALHAEGIDLVYLAAPTTGGPRLLELGRRSRGFLYLVPVTGVTGARERLPADFGPFVARARAASRLPLCVGFGVSNAALAREAAAHADGVIVGSALVNTIRAAGEGAASVDAVAKFLHGLRAAIDEAPPSTVAAGPPDRAV